MAYYKPMENTENISANLSLSAQEYYDAIVSRDADLDGKFFVAVKTTRIYCRPICPAPKPKFENCEFTTSAAWAEVNGFRPCKRCRPETLPGSPAWSGTLSTVSRALKLIEGGALNKGSVDDLAGRLGIGERHLRRLFKKHLGVSPKKLAGDKRLYLAKTLLADDDMSIAEVALAAGFSSIRRFNDAFKECFNESPTDYKNKIKD